MLARLSVEAQTFDRAPESRYKLNHIITSLSGYKALRSGVTWCGHNINSHIKTSKTVIPAGLSHTYRIPLVTSKLLFWLSDRGWRRWRGEGWSCPGGLIASEIRRGNPWRKEGARSVGQSLAAALKEGGKKDRQGDRGSVCSVRKRRPRR